MEHKGFELIIAIVNFGMGSKMLKSAKKYGITGGTIALAKGTARKGILNYLGLGDIRKEMLCMLTDKKTACDALDALSSEYSLNKPNHGIIFTMSVCNAAGCSKIKENHSLKGEETSMYKLITTIVEKGNAEDVVDAATLAGAKGGTILSARGSGIHEHTKVFSMNIEPEKEIVMILVEEATVEEVVKKINEKMNIDEPGRGIVYVQDVNKTYGIYK
ncbi:MAG: P-II family nitrogen regulator [Eubacteriales bacterium]